MRLDPSQLSIREVIGQLMMPMLPDTADLKDAQTWNKTLQELDAYAFGGYIVFRGDSTDTPDMIAEIQSLSDIPLLISSDLERGVGQQLKGFTDFPHSMALGAAMDPDAAFQMGAITALEAKRAGIHLIFAPTVDLADHPDNPIINIRGISASPRVTAQMGLAFAQGVKRYGGIATAKHFPGHGPTNVDSHVSLPLLDVSRHRLESLDLLPFRRMIDGGVGAIMVGHLAIPALDDTGLPASMSKRIVGDLLREQLKFDGLVVTDALMMGALIEKYSDEEIAVRAIQAGVDILLMPRDPEAVVRGVLRALEEGALTKYRLLESVERIFQAKHELGLWHRESDYGFNEDDDHLPDTLPDYTPAVLQITDAAVTLQNNRSIEFPFHPNIIYFIDDDNNQNLRDYFKTIGGQQTYFVDDENLLDLTSQQNVLLIVSSEVKAWKNRIGLSLPQQQWVSELRRKCEQLVVLSATTPYLANQIPDADAFVYCYSQHVLSIQSALRAIAGEIPFKGTAPVELPWDITQYV
jgi:beta-N-acetylhexosaminidase